MKKKSIYVLDFIFSYSTTVGAASASPSKTSENTIILKIGRKRNYKRSL